MQHIVNSLLDDELNGQLDLSRVSLHTLHAVMVKLQDEPAAAAFFRALCRAETEQCDRAALDLVQTAGDPGFMAEIIRVTGTFSEKPDVFKRKLHTAFIERSGDAESHYGTRAQALLGALFLSQDHETLQRLLQAHLLDSRLDDNGNYLAHAAKVIGLLLAHVTDPALTRKLTKFLEVEAAESEAAMSLGLLELSAALELTDRSLALQSLRSAKSFLEQATRASEVRVDARLFILCIDVLLQFQDESRDHDLGDLLNKVREAAFEYSAFVLPSAQSRDRKSWIGIAGLEGLRWSELAMRVASLDLSIVKPAWLNAARIIEEELILVFTASRSILKQSRDGGIEAILHPRVIGSLQKERAQLAALDQWIVEKEGELSLPDAVAMREKVAQSMEASLHRNPTAAAVPLRTAAEILNDQPIASSIRADAARTLGASLVALNLDSVEPVTIEIWEQLRNGLTSNPDYENNPLASQLFNAVLYYTIGFLSSRESLSAVSIEGIDYLFNRSLTTPPLEANLQKDYYRHLQATPLRELCSREPAEIAHGRADIGFSYNGIKTVAELKQTRKNYSLSELVEKFGLQTIAYQRTNVTFCILMVLDLFDRGGGSGHLRELIGLREKSPRSGDTNYSVVVFRVQGRKKTPSRLKD